MPSKAMDRGLLEAAIRGDLKSLEKLDFHDLNVLQNSTPRGNTCLHIASAHGRKRFCEEVVGWSPSLLAAVNNDGETPLLNAVTSGHDQLASFLLRCCRRHRLSVAILQQDNHKCNALHHAVSRGYEKLALELIAAEPALSHPLNNYEESPMFIAVMRDLTNVVVKLLEVPGSTHSGVYGCNAMHAAVRAGNEDIAKRIMGTHPELAKVEATITKMPTKKWKKGQDAASGTAIVKDKKMTPVRLAVEWNRIEVLRVMLEHDQTLGYEIATGDVPLLVSAAFAGHVGTAQEILKHCPDAPCSQKDGWTCLHQAVWSDRREFVEFIMSSQDLRSKLVNMRNRKGKTALHYAVQKCNPAMVSALLSYKEVDVTMFDKEHKTAMWKLFDAGTHAKTLNWNEIIIRLTEADPKGAMSISDFQNLHKAVKQEVTKKSRENVRSLTETYTSNTSLVAILMATITFAAAFTLPGGYSSNTGSEGLPIMARKFAFQAFLIFDTLAMCSSFAVAFICIIARWEDLEFLLYYRSFTKKLMWFAYMATTIAFATGLYTVLAPRLLWLAIAISLLSVFLPILTKLLGEWHALKLQSRLTLLKFRSNRLGSNSKIDFLNVV